MRSPDRIFWHWRDAVIPRTLSGTGVPRSPRQPTALRVICCTPHAIGAISRSHLSVDGTACGSAANFCTSATITSRVAREVNGVQSTLYVVCGAGCCHAALPPWWRGSRPLYKYLYLPAASPRGAASYCPHLRHRRNLRIITAADSRHGGRSHFSATDSRREGRSHSGEACPARSAWRTSQLPSSSIGTHSIYVVATRGGLPICYTRRNRAAAWRGRRAAWAREAATQEPLWKLCWSYSRWVCSLSW